MQKLGKAAFVLAPICLFASFFSSAVFQSKTLMSVFIVAATIFLILAVIGKVMESRKGSDGEDGGRS
mgnify:FL=1